MPEGFYLSIQAKSIVLLSSGRVKYQSEKQMAFNYESIFIMFLAYTDMECV
jgi:hypothetical protein